MKLKPLETYKEIAHAKDQTLKTTDQHVQEVLKYYDADDDKEQICIIGLKEYVEAIDAVLEEQTHGLKLLIGPDFLDLK